MGWRLARGVVPLAVIVAALALLAAPSGSAQPPRTGTAAPDVTGGGPWINSAPLTLAALRGRVVAVEFWTYG
jgi:ABC-type nitrate/sulfonate/bicarbonate transport system substrate-binding protein